MILYLHGLASSPGSARARSFGQRLRARGVRSRCPDLNELVPALMFARPGHHLLPAFGATFARPTLIFQGLHDTSADHGAVERFARDRRNVTLSLLDDGRDLLAGLPRI